MFARKIRHNAGVFATIVTVQNKALNFLTKGHLVEQRNACVMVDQTIRLFLLFVPVAVHEAFQNELGRTVSIEKDLRNTFSGVVFAYVKKTTRIAHTPNRNTYVGVSAAPFCQPVFLYTVIKLFLVEICYAFPVVWIEVQCTQQAFDIRRGAILLCAYYVTCCLNEIHKLLPIWWHCAFTVFSTRLRP
ncbi:hypothetical protein D3C85_1244360 [compost metagenome]